MQKHYLISFGFVTHYCNGHMVLNTNSSNCNRIAVMESIQTPQSAILFRLWKRFPIAVENLDFGKVKSSLQEAIRLPGGYYYFVWESSLLVVEPRMDMFKVNGRQNHGKPCGNSAGRAPSMRVII